MNFSAINIVAASPPHTSGNLNGTFGVLLRVISAKQYRKTDYINPPKPNFLRVKPKETSVMGFNWGEHIFFSQNNLGTQNSGWRRRRCRALIRVRPNSRVLPRKIDRRQDNKNTNRILRLRPNKFIISQHLRRHPDFCSTDDFVRTTVLPIHYSL